MNIKILSITKRIVAMLFVLIFAVLCLTSCGYNKQIIDLDYKYNYAIIFLPDGSTIEGKVSTWNDYENSDMVQVKIDSVTYLTHSSNVILETR